MPTQVSRWTFVYGLVYGLLALSLISGFGVSGRVLVAYFVIGAVAGFWVSPMDEEASWGGAWLMLCIAAAVWLSHLTPWHYAVIPAAFAGAYFAFWLIHALFDDPVTGYGQARPNVSNHTSLYRRSVGRLTAYHISLTLWTQHYARWVLVLIFIGAGICVGAPVGYDWSGGNIYSAALGGVLGSLFGLVIALGVTSDDRAEEREYYSGDDLDGTWVNRNQKAPESGGAWN